MGVDKLAREACEVCGWWLVGRARGYAASLWIWIMRAIRDSGCINPCPYPLCWALFERRYGLLLFRLCPQFSSDQPRREERRKERRNCLSLLSLFSFLVFLQTKTGCEAQNYMPGFYAINSQYTPFSFLVGQGSFYAQTTLCM